MIHMERDLLKNASLTAVQPSFYREFEGYRERKPISPFLQQYIGSFYEIITRGNSILSVPVVPDGCMDIIFISESNEIHPYLLRTAPSILGMNVNSNRNILGIRFKPVGISKFIHYTTDENSPYMIPLEEFNGSEKLCIYEFNQKYTFEAKCDVLEEILSKNLIEDNSSMELVHQIAAYIISKNGIVTVNQISKEYYYSSRYINRLFNENVGISPKKFCEIVQLQNVLNTVYNTNDSMANIAAQTGYYDQSHMNHVIKRLLNTTSSKLRNNEFFDEIRDNLDIKYIY